MKRNNIFHISAIVIAAFTFFSISVYSQTWQKLGETGQYINFIHTFEDNPDKIIVGADFFPTDICKPDMEFLPLIGTGYQVSTDGGQTFSDPVLSNLSVYDILIDPQNPMNWYAAARKGNRGGIAVSKDGGENWTSFPLKCDASYQVMDLEHIPGLPKKFAGAAVNAGKGFLYTTDDFETCRQNEELDISSRCIAVSKADSSLIFMAGDNYHPGVFRSRDRGQTWEKCTSGIEGLRIHCVLPLSSHPAYVLAAADTVTALQEVHGKGVYMSTDTGKTWFFAGCEGNRVFDLAQHPQDDKYVAAACDSSGVWFSAAYGAYFKQASDGLPPNSSVRHVAVPNWETDKNEGFRALCAVFSDEGISGKGLYLSKRVTTRVEERAAQDKSGMYFEKIYPSPFKDVLNISWYNPYSQNLEIRIYDMFGKEIIEFSKYYVKGTANYRWQSSRSVSAGTYNIVISSAKGSISKSIIKIK